MAAKAASSNQGRQPLMDSGGVLIRAEELTRQGLEISQQHENSLLGCFLFADTLDRINRTAEASEEAAWDREIQAAMR